MKAIFNFISDANSSNPSNAIIILLVVLLLFGAFLFFAPNTAKKYQKRK